ncbi:MAG: hypothetical protein KIT84_12650 [Labilithrix sp.]|nr:hypothetical protein [Labilithrix sp.]MCW5811864.1 hypothetical protein [Labilithrix sp.]
MRRHIGFPALLALGASLARRGPLAAISLGICALTVFVACIVAVAYATRGGSAPAYAVPIVTSSAVAWGGGILLAFSASASALRRDRVEGVRELFVTRTTSLRGYIVARVGGLAALLVLVVAGGTALTGTLAVLASLKAEGLPRTMQASAAAIAYAVGFAVVVAPVAFAALGARTRMTGYLFLLAVLLLPEAITSALEGRLPTELLEVLTIPSALASLRAAIAPGTSDVLRLLRATIALVAFGAAALVWIRRDLARLEHEA